MVKVKECPECECVMECTAWHFEDDVGDDQGAGDFDCRNCDMLLNNESTDIVTIRGYSTALFDNISDDEEFDEFVADNEEDIVYGYDDDSAA